MIDEKTQRLLCNAYDYSVPKVVDHELRRQELVEATWRVIADEGIESATMRRIAEVAGCTTGRVTHYFQSRDDVLIASLRQVHAAAAKRMVTHVEHATGADALRSVLLEALPIDAARQLEWRVWLAFWGRAATEPNLRLEHQRRYVEWRRLLHQLIRDTGPLRSQRELRANVDFVAGTIDGIGIQGALEPDRFRRADLERVVDLLVDAVTHD